VTEPAPSPGSDPTRSGTEPDPAGAVPGSPWAAPGGGRGETASAPSEGAGPGYAPPPAATPGAPGVGAYPPGGHAQFPAPPGVPPHHRGYGPPSGPGPHWGPPPAPGGGWPTSGAYPGSPPAPGGGWGPGSPAVGPRPGMPPPPREAPRPPKRVDPVPGTPFGVVHLDVPPVTSGLAVGSLVTGIASILVSLLVFCFGIAGPDYGGAWAAGAFTVLGGIAGTAAIVAGLLSRRQVRRPAPPPAVRFAGRGLAVAGLSCGGAGLLLSLLGLAVALVVQIT
jgi:hypothetical protein